MLRTLLRQLSPGGARGRLSILIFHRVLPAPDPLFPGETDAAKFDAICAWLAHWFTVLPLHDAVRRLATQTLPAGAACITFDDGYADNHDHALPILQRHGLSATFFVATGFLDGGRMFNDSVIEAVRHCRADELDLRDLRLAGIDRLTLGGTTARRSAIERVLQVVKYLPLQERDAAVDALVRHCGNPALPGNLMMTTAQVRALHRAGMGIGAHTVSHPILARLDAATASSEIADSRRVLQGIIDAPVPLFAYPNGKPDEDYSGASVAAVRAAGFEAAVSTSWGVASRHSDLFQLPRFTPWDRTRLKFGLRLAHNLSRPGQTVPS